MIKTISTYTIPMEAYIAKGRLEAEGIPVYIADEHFIAAQWTISQAIGGVRLQVPASFASQAKKIIKELEQGSYEEPIFQEAIESKIIHCPKCQSEDVKQVNWFWKLAFVSMFLSILPLPFSRYRFRCNNCSHSWIAKDLRSYSVIFIIIIAFLITIVVCSIFLLLYYWRCKYIYCPI